MADKSFYNLDYIIEVNGKRVEQNIVAYHKVLDRFTNIILIYSAMTIFLIPIIRDVIFGQIKNSFFYLNVTLFFFSIICSLNYAVRLMIPARVAYLEDPKKYYSNYLENYEQTINDMILQIKSQQ